MVAVNSQGYRGQAATSVSLGEAARRHQHAILLVDDSPEDRVAFRTYLARDDQAEYTFHEAELGDEGVTLCSCTPIDCILLDYLLPDMDGLEFLRILRDGQGGRSVPVPIIALTGQADEAMAARLLEAGARAYLAKKRLDASTLCATVRRVIAEQSAAR